MVKDEIQIQGHDQNPSNSQGMGTDDFLRTFGNGGKDFSMNSNGINPEMVRNFIKT
jgi:hypothetical protein